MVGEELSLGNTVGGVGRPCILLGEVDQGLESIEVSGDQSDIIGGADGGDVDAAKKDTEVGCLSMIERRIAHKLVGLATVNAALFHATEVIDGTHQLLVILNDCLPGSEPGSEVGEGTASGACLEGSRNDVFGEDSIKGGLGVKEQYIDMNNKG